MNSAATTELPFASAATSAISDENIRFLKQLSAECESMVHYAVGQAIKIPDELTPALEHLNKDAPRLSISSTIKLHNRLAEVVAPAMPHTIHTLMNDPHKGTLMGIFGPLPNVRYLIVAALFFTTMFVLTSLSSHVNYTNLEAGIYSMSGWDLFIVLSFLMSASGLGACFNALFSSYRYVSNATYDTRYDSSYWIRIILGLMAGLVMSQVISLESLTSFQTVTIAQATAPAASEPEAEPEVPAPPLHAKGVGGKAVAPETSASAGSPTTRPPTAAEPNIPEAWPSASRCWLCWVASRRPWSTPCCSGWSRPSSRCSRAAAGRRRRFRRRPHSARRWSACSPRAAWPSVPT